MTEGNIIYFTPYHFDSDYTPKNKFFVVLKNKDNKSILASLPTSKNYIPPNDEIEHGCVELPDIDLTCFVISDDVIVTKCNKKFELKTFIYGYGLITPDIVDMNKRYVLEGSDYIIWGKMKDELLIELIECLSSSATVKSRHKKLLIAE